MPQDRRAAIIPVNIRGKTLSLILITLIALTAFLFVIGALWGRYDFPDLRESGRNAAHLNRRIQEAFQQQTPIRYDMHRVETKRGERLALTYQYTARVPENVALSAVISRLSAAIEASGGEIFQTYSQPESRETILVVGIGATITHTIRLTRPTPAPALALSTAQPSPEPLAPFRVAIVIDDLGANLLAAQRLLAFKQDLTFSILPHQKHSADVAQLIHAERREILLHLPMEPLGYPAVSPGRGALLASMIAERIQQTIDGDLASVPFAVGANNHTGSRLTAHAGQMQTVMRHLQQRQLFFIDSRTTDETVAYAVARQIGVKSAQRKVFLDVKPGVDFARRQLAQLASLAEQGQPAIAIGHPKEDTLRALEEMLPEFERRGIRIVRVSEFLE